MKTEKIAKTLLCPKKLDKEDETDRCVEGCACMMWIWSDDEKADDYEISGDCGLIFPSFITVGEITTSKR